ncbi:lytic transglycosylase domain-containing protein [Lysobacter sp. GX 14042]|uniref:lytic transglycosylase domain-containing protein n=1 Tax=Lysobacter sp. GX 14042 TaxID=2907155 RepID=UPI001F3243EB|nr:lytic transglycosylase domain-containing protein [Lysobacter sp. GX 14042]MCE7032481.1 lytic transglycosylase domain-containing protein [Lysobacter sp. GX 14042]
MRWRSGVAGLGLALVMAVASGAAPASEPATSGIDTRSGLSIYENFRAGLADPACPADASQRWQAHFATTPGQLATGPEDSLALFGYVVDAVRAAHLPTEYALIPFIESGYRADARSPSGPAGLWQMITVTARNHKVPIRAGYDGRLSPVDSTRAAVRYLKTLHGMFAGDWRLAAMAYNAGEHRMLGVLRRNGQQARDVRLDELEGVPRMSRAYVSKLQALTCVMLEAHDAANWQAAMDRPVPRLQAIELPGDVERVREWASQHGQDAAGLRRLNPAHVDGRIARAAGQPARLLVAAPAAPQGTAVSPAGAAGGSR